MRYIDNGTGDSLADALFSWLQTVLTVDVVGIRWQSGFFDASVLGVFAPTLQRLADAGLDAIVLIGSNDGVTQASAGHQLVDLLGLPRPNACLGVVNYADGFYHPKTIHLSYGSGRQVGYVGSANLTSRGINGLNIEAGIALDTDQGDPVDLITDIGRAVTEWFSSTPPGFFPVASHEAVDRLARRGILTTAPAVRPPRDGDGRRGLDPLPRRGRSHALPPPPARGTAAGDGIEDAPPETPQVVDDVLIAELIGPGRWGQAAFPKWFIDNFFEVQPDTGDVLHLLPVTEAGGVGTAENAVCGHKGSGNWYYELRLAAAIGAYPRQPPKPIGVFHRIAHQTCRYTILMPDDDSYPHVSGCLTAYRNRLNRPRNQLPRTIVTAQVLRDAWPHSWFFAT